jgi:hypothetical protein
MLIPLGDRLRINTLDHFNLTDGASEDSVQTNAVGQSAKYRNAQISSGLPPTADIELQIIMHAAAPAAWRCWQRCAGPRRG